MIYLDTNTGKLEMQGGAVDIMTELTLLNFTILKFLSRDKPEFFCILKEGLCNSIEMAEQEWI